MSSPLKAPTREIGYAAPNAAAGWWQVLEDEATPELRWPWSVRVYNRMRGEESQVASVLRAVILPVLRTSWWVEPAGARDEVVEHVANDLGLPIQGFDAAPNRRTRDRFSWPEHLRLSLLDQSFGHMFFEQQYRINDAGTRAHLKKLAPRMPTTLSAINVDRDGGLVSIEQHGVSRPIPVSQLVGYANDREGGAWTGRSLLRPAYKFWLLKDRLLRVQAQSIERNGMGVPRYKGAQGEKTLDAGLKIAQDWRTGDAAGAAIPFGSELDLVGVTGSVPDALPVIRYYDEQTARAALLHFLNLGGQASTGSWALGTTFADFFILGLQTVAEQKRDTANQHIVEDLVDINYGEDELAPRIGFAEIGSRHPATAQAIKFLIDSKALSWDPQLEQHLRQQYGLPAGSGDERPAADGEDGSS